MITSLRLRNFRAFRDQRFEFSKINIFVGANSTGKSSAISAINFIAQSILQEGLSSIPIALNGPFEQLGTFIDVVHGNRANTPLGLEIAYTTGSTSSGIDVELKYRRLRRELEISQFAFHQGSQTIYNYRARKDSYDIFLYGTNIENIITGQKRRPNFRLLFPFDPNVAIYSPVSATQRAIDVPSENEQLLRDIDAKLRRGRSAFRRLFDNFDSLSPFRDPPQRTYLFTGETPSRIGRTGSNVVSILVNDASRRGRRRDPALDRISEWLRVSGIGRGLALRPLTERHFEICVIDLDGKQHNICDVGFGCSQVLPVLVGALNTLFDRPAGPSIFVVQEPEIHLHPNAQATLGSFFASISGSMTQLFIETHSDNLILRILRHVAMGQLDPADVAVFKFENTADGKQVTRLSLNDRAAFVPTWPDGFFPQREQEVLALARSKRRRGEQIDDRQLEFSYPEKGGTQ